MIPARYAPILFAFLLSGMMSFLVSGVVTFGALGLVDGFLGLWITAWTKSWPVAFAAALVVGPFTRKLVAKLTAAP